MNVPIIAAPPVGTKSNWTPSEMAIFTRREIGRPVGRLSLRSCMRLNKERIAKRAIDASLTTVRGCAGLACREKTQSILLYSDKPRISP